MKALHARLQHLCSLSQKLVLCEMGRYGLWLQWDCPCPSCLTGTAVIKRGCRRQHTNAQPVNYAVVQAPADAGGLEGMHVAQVQQAHRMSCGPFSLKYGGEADTAGVSHASGVRSRSRR